MADSPTGPFERAGVILESDPEIATGAGHNSVISLPSLTDDDRDSEHDWYMVYHRRPIPNDGRDHRVTCIDRLEFNADGTIKPVVMTFEGVAARPIGSAADTP
jgi:hypothetical protein